jgi:ATP-dependent phosphofructokinase / diphosphate-dependent phosphofructokinase
MICRGNRFTIVVVAEGIKLPPELKQIARGGPVGNLVGEAISLIANKEVRVTVLGHIQRGGSPSPYDCVLATCFGVAVVELIADAKFGKMVALRGDSIVPVDLADAIGKLKTVRPDGELVSADRARDRDRRLTVEAADGDRRRALASSSANGETPVSLRSTLALL